LSTLYAILTGIDVLLAVALIGLVLLQHGKGADAGAAFGSGASATVFGAQGSASFLTKMTAWLAAAFFVNSLALAYMAAHRPKTESVIDKLQVEAPAPEAPASPPAEEAAPAPNGTPADLPPVEVVPGAGGADLPAMPEEDSQVPENKDN
jgi:preprotein translocase subunit SecG